jgi:hypothetical protein
MKPWLRYLIAAVVAGHGFIYLNFSLGRLPAALEGWRGISWVLGDAVTGDRLKRLALALHAVAGIGILASGIAMAFAPAAPRLWRPLAVAGSAVAILAFAAFWDGRAPRLVQQGAIGAVLSLLLLLGAIALPQVLR